MVGVTFVVVEAALDKRDFRKGFRRFVVARDVCFEGGAGLALLPTALHFSRPIVTNESR